MPSVASLFICSLYPHPNLGKSPAFLSSCASSDLPHLLNPHKLASQSQYYTETTIATSPVTCTLLNLIAILCPHVPALSAEGTFQLITVHQQCARSIGTRTVIIQVHALTCVLSLHAHTLLQGLRIFGILQSCTSYAKSFRRQ